MESEAGSEARSLPSWRRDALCVVCPAQTLGLGAFDVSDRPGPDNSYDALVGYRVSVATGVAVCVHPYRVGLPPAGYASAGHPLPPPDLPAPRPTERDLELPAELVDLEGWLVAVLRVAGPERMAPALERAEAIASERFDTAEVVSALRRVLGYELSRL